MKVLKGTITCEGNPKIEEGSVVNVSVIDCSIACKASKTLGSVQLNNIKSFPFNYEVEYDESQVIPTAAYGFRVACRITKGDKLSFINDTAFSILLDGELLDHRDFHVIPVPQS